MIVIYTLALVAVYCGIVAWNPRCENAVMAIVFVAAWVGGLVTL